MDINSLCLIAANAFALLKIRFVLNDLSGGADAEKLKRRKMPRVTTQKKSSKGKSVKCGKCGVAIKAGDQYKKWSKRVGFGRISGVTYYRCMESKCAPSGSDLLSGRAAELAAIAESWDAIDRNGEPADLRDACESVKEEVESFRDEMQGGFDNMPEGLQQGDTGQLIEERCQQMDEIIDAIDECCSTLDDLESEITNLEDEKLELEEKIADREKTPDTSEADIAELEEWKNRLEEIESELEDKRGEADSALDDVAFDMS